MIGNSELLTCWKKSKRKCRANLKYNEKDVKPLLEMFCAKTSYHTLSLKDTIKAYDKIGRYKNFTINLYLKNTKNLMRVFVLEKVTVIKTSFFL